jgi:hypothetical protein
MPPILLIVIASAMTISPDEALRLTEPQQTQLAKLNAALDHPVGNERLIQHLIDHGYLENIDYLDQTGLEDAITEVEEVRAMSVEPPRPRAAPLGSRLNAFQSALTRLVGEEAELDPRVVAFRQQHLPHGMTLLPFEIHGWIAEQVANQPTDTIMATLPVPRGWQRRDPVPPPPKHLPVRYSFPVVQFLAPPNSAPKGQSTSQNDALDTQQDVRHDRATEDSRQQRQVFYAPRDQMRNDQIPDDQVNDIDPLRFDLFVKPAAPGSVLLKLSELGKRLGPIHGWTEAQTVTFILTGHTPLIGLIQVTKHDPPVYNGESCAWGQRIQLTTHPAATVEDVAAAYKAARAELEIPETYGHIRVKGPSERNLQVATFVAGRTGSWQQKMDAWNELHPEPESKFRYTRLSNFKRDTQDTRMRVLNIGYRANQEPPEHLDDMLNELRDLNTDPHRPTSSDD